MKHNVIVVAQSEEGVFTVLCESGKASLIQVDGALAVISDIFGGRWALSVEEGAVSLRRRARNGSGTDLVPVRPGGTGFQVMDRDTFLTDPKQVGQGARTGFTVLFPIGVE